MSITLQLDNQALAQLLGGDSKVELELRNCIVQEFARKHLKAVLKDEAFQSFLSKEKEVVQLALAAKIRQHIGEVQGGKGVWNKPQVVLTPEVNRKINEAVWTAHQEIVNRHCKDITERLEERFNRYEKELEQCLEARIQKIEAQLIDARVKEKVNSILNNLSS